MLGREQFEGKASFWRDGVYGHDREGGAGSIFTAPGPRPIQSTSRNVRMCVCLFVSEMSSCVM